MSTTSKNVFEGFLSLYTKEGMPNNYIRGAIWVGTIVVVYIGGKAIYSKLFPSNDTVRVQEEQKQFKTDLDNSIKITPPTYSDTQYNQWADSIANAISGTMYGDVLIFSPAWQTTKDIFVQLKNNTDYLMLIKAFGLRDIDGGYFGSNLTQVDLPTALGHKMTNVELNGALITPFFNNGLNQVLAENGITYSIVKI